MVGQLVPHISVDVFWLYAYLAGVLITFVWCWAASYQAGVEDGDDWEENVLWSTIASSVVASIWLLMLVAIVLLIIVSALDIYLPGRRGPRWMKEIADED